MSTPGILLGGRYQLDGRIAAGAVGEVWRATDLVLSRPVAVKRLRDGYAGQAEAMERFRAEARHAGALSHPGIARVFDYGEMSPMGGPYLVMELVNGEPLSAILERVGSLIPGKPIRAAARRRWPTVRGSWRRKVEGGGDVEGIPTLHGERTRRS